MKLNNIGNVLLKIFACIFTLMSSYLLFINVTSNYGRLFPMNKFIVIIGAIIILAILLIIAFAIVKMNKKDVKLELNKLVELLGGKDNILDTEVEMSRFKVTLKDISKANKEGIIKLGAKGVVEIDDQLKIILGNNAKKLKKYIDDLK